MAKKQIYDWQHCTNKQDCHRMASHWVVSCGTKQKKRCTCMWCVVQYADIDAEA